jgi:hypothetical protein
MTPSISAGASERLRPSAPGTTGRPFKVASHVSSQGSSSGASAGLLACSWPSDGISGRCPRWRLAPYVRWASFVLHLRQAVRSVKRITIKNRGCSMSVLSAFRAVAEGRRACSATLAALPRQVLHGLENLRVVWHLYLPSARRMRITVSTRDMAERATS